MSIDAVIDGRMSQQLDQAGSRRSDVDFGAHGPVSSGLGRGSEINGASYVPLTAVNDRRRQGVPAALPSLDLGSEGYRVVRVQLEEPPPARTLSSRSTVCVSG